ncbi:MAG: tyrosine-type recombinase/integrase [Defluviitaleaceae bacterium]|nr:tyrosine-type recombinase/integrase [Defluviitaleaceae bacterium]MCL2262480.1 tyrosine-type recombinase/integrase [Defluviitaleaceae bacterium]
MKLENYHAQQEMQNIIKLREMLKTLPQFVVGYFRSLGDQTAALTRLAYAYDLRIFFTFLSEEVLHIAVADISLEDMAKVESEHIEEFMEYLSYYIPAENPDAHVKNASLGKSRKLAAVRGIFKYLYRKKHIPANPAELVAFPKINEKAITTLEVDEIAKLLDEVDSGENLTPRQKVFHELTKVRDAAIITLLLGTGMRVSECVGLDIRDIDFEVNGLRVIRKGGDEMVLYFGQEVEAALCAYLEIREEASPIEGHENALFLSLKNRRLTDRAIQNMVKKYASLITQLKNISPHKLRSTFGTQLYAETGDIYLVANVLGHADVNTTRKHYAKMDDTYRRKAANAVRLRD